MEQVEKQIGKTPLALIMPPFPDILEDVWKLFIDLSNTRSQGYSGPLPITYSEIEAWSRITETPITSWEVSVIKRLDNVYIRALK